MDGDILINDKSRRRLPLWLMMLIALCGGIAAGLVLGPQGAFALAPDILRPVTDWVMLPARLFLALITMVVMPLVFCSIVLAITESGGLDFLRSAGLRVVIYFVVTTCIAVMIGIGVNAAMKPSAHVPQSWVITQIGSAEEAVKKASGGYAGGKSIPQMIVDIIPVNPAAAVLEQQMLQIVIAALLAGLALAALPRAESQSVISVCIGAQAVCMKIVFWALWLAPMAVFAFLFRLTVETGAGTLAMLSWYVATVLLGLAAIMGMYLLIVTFVARRSPLAFLRAARDAQMLAFSSSSSAATMPVTLATAEGKMGVRPAVARLVVPLGTTINMDGTAMYQIIVALFLTGLLGIDLSFGQTILLAVTVVAAAIGTPGTPGVGLVILSVILTNLGIPPEAVGIILSVDRILDMCRTVINVTGDLTASVVVERWAQTGAVKAPVMDLQEKTV